MAKKIAEQEQPKTPKKSRNKSYVFFAYYIRAGFEFPNPSPILRHFALRFDGSVWFMPEAMTLLPECEQLINDMNSHKKKDVRCRIFRFDPAEREELQKYAREAMEAEIARIQAQLIENLDDAQKAYDEAMEAITANDGEKTQYNITVAREKKMKRSLKSAGELLNAAIDCAMVFDETDNVQSLLDGLRKAIQSRNKSFDKLIEARVNMLPEHERGRKGTRMGELIFGYSHSNIVVWMGRNNYTAEEAIRVMNKLGSNMKDTSIQSTLSTGKTGRAGQTIELNKEQIALLEEYRNPEGEE